VIFHPGTIGAAGDLRQAGSSLCQKHQGCALKDVWFARINATAIARARVIGIAALDFPPRIVKPEHLGYLHGMAIAAVPGARPDVALFRCSKSCRTCANPPNSQLQPGGLRQCKNLGMATRAVRMRQAPRKGLPATSPNPGDAEIHVLH
jgi:hypothetical protein